MYKLEFLKKKCTPQIHNCEGDHQRAVVYMRVRAWSCVWPVGAEHLFHLGFARRRLMFGIITFSEGLLNFVKENCLCLDV